MRTIIIIIFLVICIGTCRAQTFNFVCEEPLEASELMVGAWKPSFDELAISKVFTNTIQIQKRYRLSDFTLYDSIQRTLHIRYADSTTIRLESNPAVHTYTGSNDINGDFDTIDEIYSTQTEVFLYRSRYRK